MSIATALIVVYFHNMPGIYVIITPPIYPETYLGVMGPRANFTILNLNYKFSFFFCIAFFIVN